jgi:succinyl-CoA synthetase alpha subunit
MRFESEETGTMKKALIRKDAYVDSVFLMLMSRDLERRADVVSATVVMGTPVNKDLLLDQGFSTDELGEAGSADLVIALECETESAFETVVVAAKDLLAGKKKRSASGVSEAAPRSIDGVLDILPDANIAVISLPGAYAAREARKALNKGLHVMLFSNNVSLDEEVALKNLAREKGLLVMGPDCGTAIISGKPLCFANVVSRGPVGIVAASGSGLQEVTCLIDRFGSGVSQAIGTGGRDLKNEKVGGATMLAGIDALGADGDTSVIVVVSKPPAPSVAARVMAALERTGKPAVVHFIGWKIPAGDTTGTIHWASSLEETARFAVRLAGDSGEVSRKDSAWPFDRNKAEIDALVEKETRDMERGQKFIRGYYTGGTLADEALFLLHRLVGSVYSNNHTDPAFVLSNPEESRGHTVVDLGDDVFTVGRPHPMIEPSTRTDRIDAEREDPGIAVMLVDCVLGYGSHPDPAGAMIPSLVEAKKAACTRGGYLSVIASVTGTPGDVQGLNAQVAKLERAGVVVMPSNYQASMLAVRITEKQTGLSSKAAATGSEALPAQASAATVAYSTATADLHHILSLFSKGPIAANLGLESFASNLRACGAAVVQVDWTPPAGGDIHMIEVLDRLEHSCRIDIDGANAQAVQRILKGKPVIEGIGIAKDVVPGMRSNLILHAGPPVTWDRMCGPMRGAVIGGLMYEGLAASPEEAEKLADSGEISFEPCHHHSAVGPMAGVMTSRMPVWIVRNETHGNRAYATLNEGLGKALRYGAFSGEVLDRLRWMESVLAPILSKTIERHGPIDLRSLVVQALQMGDEGHNRNRAGTSLLIRELAPHLVMLDEKKEALSEVLLFMHGNDHFFLNLSMAGAKCIMDAAAGIEGSTVITTMARNGTEFGIRLSGLNDRWFTGPASMVEGLYLPGFGPQDAAPDIGDSVITETSGIGAFAMAASPAIVKFVGGVPADAIAYTKRMYEITLAENEEYRIPALDFRGTPTAIDVRKVVEKGILPMINTGIAHKKPGIGMVGAGLVKPPENCFRDALVAFAEKYCC